MTQHMETMRCDHKSTLISIQTFIGNKKIILAPIAPYQHEQRIEIYTYESLITEQDLFDLAYHMSYLKSYTVSCESTTSGP